MFNSKGLLHTAVINRDYDAIKNLLANGADISAKGKNGLNPISLAIKYDDKYAFDLIINKIHKVYENLVHKHTPISKDPSSIIASFVTGIEPSNEPDNNKAKNCTENETLKEDNKYIKAIDDAMIKVMYNPEKYYYKLKLCGILFIKSDQICPKKHRMLLDTAFDLNGQKPNNTTEQGKFENALIANTRTLKESLLKAIAEGNDQKAAKLCQWFYKRNANGQIIADEQISLKIYENRKKLKKTSLKYFGYGLKALISYYIISYAVLIGLHGLMIYGTYACIRAYVASPLVPLWCDQHHHWIYQHTGTGYRLIAALLGILSFFYIGMYCMPPVLALGKNVTLRNWQANESYYRSLKTKIEQPAGSNGSTMYGS